MKLKELFDFYLKSSIHVAFSVVALSCVTQLLYGIAFNSTLLMFLFCSSVAGYNFVKYHTLFFAKLNAATHSVKAIAAISFLLVPVAGYFFLQLDSPTQIATVIIGILTVLYTIPFLPGRKNARSWSGAKIYIVAFCWAAATVLLPVLEAGIPIEISVAILFIQRFLLIIVLLLIFDIVDMNIDQPELHTVPQMLGPKGTKILGYVLLSAFFLLEFLKPDVTRSRVIELALFSCATAIFLLFANPRRSRYYTLFWVESIPILWLLIMLLIK